MGSLAESQSPTADNHDPLPFLHNSAILTMHEHLGRYLNDHFAGSVAALELIDHLLDRRLPADQEQFLTSLRDEITADREVLLGLMNRLQVSQSRPRQALAWLAEQLSEWKLHFDDQAGGAFRWFETLEALSLGIEGKRLLWVALAKVAQHVAELQSPDYEALAASAQRQRDQVESFRQIAAASALTE